MSQRPDEAPENAGMEIEPKPQKSGIAALGVPVVASLILAYLGFTMLLAPTFVSKPDFSANLQSMSAEVATAKKDVADLKLTVATKEALVGVNTEVSNIKNRENSFATKESISAIQNDVNNLKNTATNNTELTNKVSSLQSSLNTLSDKITADQAKIKALEDKVATLTTTTTTTTGGAVSGQVTASVATFGGMPMGFTVDSTSAKSVTFRVTVKNGLNKQIDNIQLFLSLISSVQLPTASTATLTSNGVLWSLYNSSSSMFYFTNVTGWTGTGISIPAGQSKTYFMTFNYAPQTAPVTPLNVQFYTDLTVDSYDVAP
jgi:hypothetical protein